MMNRSRRGGKQFVSGGIYDPNTVIKNQQQTQQLQPQQQQPQQQQQQQQQHKQQQSQNVAPLQPPPVPPPAIDPDDNQVKAENFEIIDENGKLKFKKIFITRKKSSVRAKEKRIRQNRQLRKAILPKNALMALNEVKGITIGDFTTTSNTGGGFTALVTVNNKQYEGQGNSKVAAKNNACEKALRDYIITKMRQNPRPSKSHPTNNTDGSNVEAMDTSEPVGHNNEDEADMQKNGHSSDEADDVPMINLASFALYKLFMEWESEGFVIPEMHPAAAGSENENSSKEPKKAHVRNELPPNWEAVHPASLLCMMRPGITFIENGTIGEKPNVLQSVSVVVDGQEFVANGRSKKLARRNLAAVVCNTLFGTNFVKEETEKV